MIKVTINTSMSNRLSLEGTQHRIDSLYSLMERNHESKLNGNEFRIFTEMSLLNKEISKLTTDLVFGKVIGYEVLRRSIHNFREYCQMQEEICDNIITKMFDIANYGKSDERRSGLFKAYFKQIMQMAR